MAAAAAWEASYRSEMAKQFAHHLEHLRGFVAESLGKSQGIAATPAWATWKGVAGCVAVVVVPSETHEKSMRNPLSQREIPRQHWKVLCWASWCLGMVAEGFFNTHLLIILRST